MRLRRYAGFLLVTAVFATAGACSTDPVANRSAATATAATAGTLRAAPVAISPVVLEILAREVDPPGAAGRTLTLARYTIAPGVRLPSHIHPGIQLASIESGVLTYTIVSGTATVTRHGSVAGETVTGPATITLGPGDAVAEIDGMVHYGANRTERPVVILATLLTRTGSDLAVPVSTTKP